MHRASNKTRLPSASPLTRILELRGLRAFSILWAGQVVSAMGTRMINFMLGIWLWQRTGQVSTLSLLTFFAYGATVVCSPLAGALVDRVSRRLTIMLSDVGSACTTAILLVLFLTGQEHLWALILTNTLTGAFLAFQYPAYASTIASMLPKEQYPRANGMMSLVRSLPTVVGPALAGLLLKAFGIDGVLSVCIALYLIAIGTVFLVRLPSARGGSTRDGEAEGWLAWTAGFRWIAQRRGLAGLLMLTTVASLTSAMGYVAIIPLILARTGNNQVLLGIVQSVGAIGGVSGALALTLGRVPRRKMLGIITGLLVFSLLGQLIMGVGRTVLIWVVAWFFAWLAVPFVEGYSQSIWQQKAIPAIQGRVFATVQLFENLALPVGFTISGLLIDHYLEPQMKPGKSLVPIFGWLVGSGPAAGIALIFVLAGAFGTVCALAGLAAGSVRDVEDLLPDGESSVEADSDDIKTAEQILEVE
jgi:MFS transporter, DHA3 family, macrolide efflux protein